MLPFCDFVFLIHQCIFCISKLLFVVSLSKCKVSYFLCTLSFMEGSKPADSWLLLTKITLSSETPFLFSLCLFYFLNLPAYNTHVSFHILCFHNLELAFGSSCRKLATLTTSNQIKIVKTKQLSGIICFWSDIKDAVFEWGGMDRKKKTNQWLHWPLLEPVCVYL